jgi:hypothetical protein
MDYQVKDNNCSFFLSLWMILKTTRMWSFFDVWTFYVTPNCISLLLNNLFQNKTKLNHTKASFSTSAANGPKNKFDIFWKYCSSKLSQRSFFDVWTFYVTPNCISLLLNNLFQPIKKPVRTLSIFMSMAFVKDANDIS